MSVFGVKITDIPKHQENGVVVVFVHFAMALKAK